MDQETHRVIELFKGRLSGDIQPWFRAHPKVEIVTRDRSTDYRQGLDSAALQAIQIADRFHLLMNLRKLAHRRECKKDCVNGVPIKEAGNPVE